LVQKIAHRPKRKRCTGAPTSAKERESGGKQGLGADTGDVEAGK